MGNTNRWFTLGFLSAVFAAVLVNCAPINTIPEPGASENELTLDPQTGIPYAHTFQFPVSGFDQSDFGFGFASENSRFCLQSKNGQCTAYGYHLGRDTIVKKTPVNTEVVAPADGIVRLTTDVTYGGYGSDAQANPAYRGCLVVLEHEFQGGQHVTTLLGHLKCESETVYDALQKKGNPSVGALVKRGQYLGHVGHYWAGSDQSLDWHHVHWGMRNGAFDGTNVNAFVRGYAPKSEFTIDPETGIWTHPQWVDPFVIIAAHADPVQSVLADVRHHPSGSLLEDSYGSFWLVTKDDTIAPIPPDVLLADRYDGSRSVLVSDDELNCYQIGASQKSLGPVTLYQRPNSSTVVMAYSNTKERYDVIRWEALISWGYDASSLTADGQVIATIESGYAAKGYRLLRPGTLVKADESSEVSIITTQQTRRAIASGDVFEAMGFSWAKVVSIPQSVIDVVAGPRENELIDFASIHACASQPVCPGGGNCGGGGNPPLPVEVCNGLDDDGNGKIDEIFQCKAGSKGGGCITKCNTAGSLVCEAPACAWGSCEPYPENCSNTIDDDCNGLTDCDDAACKGTPACTPSSPDAGSPDPVGNTSITLHLIYTGPVLQGMTQLFAWWQPPQALPREWGLVVECQDLLAGDGVLDCTFSVPAGTSPLEFQVNLPNGGFWGDESCSPMGGCGSPVGTVTLLGPKGQLMITMKQNNKDGLPYFNGRVESVQ